ncbi:uncharacterized protein BP01DRAFT_33436 [Aspergillus saccharolyticus JOP 1030-1]|uniref:Uncharacterized protein n=1 Tax=Aspergillus saccharolyticus JOP 1030-1 TaxID=1450539 RepID=A0A318ZGZ4_9EURO|nr:hypothetical protein BP01DRAFT_33436 [Aspergillus saccharolyticus JOP 1030-1]PYH46027.1 hypothetical protein BP01DRAFT_33436 [Aspergillus saccharolyticus JOP 1030-1]
MGFLYVVLRFWILGDWTKWMRLFSRGNAQSAPKRDSEKERVWLLDNIAFGQTTRWWLRFGYSPMVIQLCHSPDYSSESGGIGEILGAQSMDEKMVSKVWLVDIVITSLWGPNLRFHSGSVCERVLRRLVCPGACRGPLVLYSGTQLQLEHGFCLVDVHFSSVIGRVVDVES